MALGDVTVTVVNTPSQTEIDTAMTALRSSGGANGKYGIVALDGRVFCWGIEEA